MCKIPYAKPHLPVPAQLELLKLRGMQVTDEPRALQYLERIGYYRLSGYWYPFRQSQLISGTRGKPVPQILDQFRPGTEFRQVVELYVFDKRLRLLLLDAIERIEVALRVDIALLLGARDPWAHRNPKELHGQFSAKVNSRTGRTEHGAWLTRLNENERRSKEDFIKHFRAKYSSDLPIWIAIELWDFGMLSVFLNGMKIADQDVIATKYGIPRRELLTSWMRAINHVRNICAHHNRLWNRSPSDQPKPPRVGEIPLLDHLANDSHAQVRLYAVAAVIQFLLRRINPTTSWADRLHQHFASFPRAPGIAAGQSGFPDFWETLPLWT
jgi:abortive infection bacteriophage resistance protein